MFYAHSTKNPDSSDWQPLSEHLRGVGALAKEFATVFHAGELANIAGLLHDIGKYTEKFQRRIAGEALRVDHATRGAILAVERYGPLGHLLAYVLAGHHAGLADGLVAGERATRTTLHDRLRGEGLPPLDEAWREIDLPEKLDNVRTFNVVKAQRNFQFAFLTRMLFSCLVDADCLDTERFYDQVEGRDSVRGTKAPSLEALRAQLDAHLAGFTGNSAVNRIRAEILTHVRQQATLDRGLFSLTVPTGGGKTLASLAFALGHAIKHGLRRVIFVIPFTSIVEQNAKVFRKALGELGEAAVLEHHSAFTVPQLSRADAERFQSAEKLRLAMENWDAPIVVTTAVQFFESLFAARSSQCRKLHNIAGSVVILDEAQTLPLKLLRPAVAAIDELARNYRTSVVLCTATQPALQVPDLKDGLDKVRELAPDPSALFRKLKRVTIRHVGVLDDDALAKHLSDAEQVLCIVNNRRHACMIYQAMTDLPGARHLTTLMCAKHRSKVLDDIRDDLANHRPCRVVSTSLIEAGVDVDFPLVLRAEAGLDSIAQAAGRCNREGRRDATVSEVRVFAVANPDWKPPSELAQFANAAAAVFGRRGTSGDLLSPETIRDYFKEVYWQKGASALDGGEKPVLRMLEGCGVDALPLETLAANFRMIDSVQMPVIVPYDDAAREALRALQYVEKAGGVARKLQPYLVQLPEKGFKVLRDAGSIQPVAPEKWDEQFMELVTMDLYDPATGLSCDDPTFLRAETLVW
ncbi:CRISPR-associated helicase/endonuclease Cas3 [Betaproteobacteria bacterium]|nr:CRISPR-associated helicase/endonuclease Cas3 [Betaproteobacteria bacterium]